MVPGSHLEHTNMCSRKKKTCNSSAEKSHTIIHSVVVQVIKQAIIKIEFKAVNIKQAWKKCIVRKP